MTFLTFYAYRYISYRINNLTKLVDNPQLFKDQIKDIALKNQENLKDEIDRLEYIFAHFFYEEKHKVRGGDG